jgi:signal peptidase
VGAKKGYSTFTQAVKTGGIIILVLLILSALFFLIVPFFGWKTEIVLSGSMEPSIPTGSVVVTRPVAPESIHVGDVIIYSFLYGPGLTTHRVVQVESDNGLKFITKGDANRDADPNPVLPVQVGGIVALDIPYAGYLISSIRTPLGLLVCLIIPAALLLVGELINLWKSLD